MVNIFIISILSVYTGLGEGARLVDYVRNGISFIIYLSNVFGPPPPGESVIAVVSNASWLFALWAYRVDKHRK